MNRKERLVLSLLIATFVAGSIVAYVKKKQLADRIRRSPIVVSDGSRRDSPTGHVSARVDLNRATISELEALPGIGYVLAARIVSYRRQNGGFRSVGELRKVAGIGPKRYGALAQLVEVPDVPDSSLLK